MNVETVFRNFSDVFRETSLWEAMRNTREDSPWHREANVAVHTAMLQRYYMENFFERSDRTDHQRLISLVACTMHDIGKPPAQVIKHSEERGTYRAYHGHEQLSARLWVDYAMSNKDVVLGEDSILKFTLMDVTNVAFMVEHHIAYGIKDKAKRQALKQSFLSRGGEELHQAWLDFLSCDQHGRIADGQEQKLAEFATWLKEWAEV